MSRKKPPAKSASDLSVPGYDDILAGMVQILDVARRTSARAVNTVMTATYWEVGRRIVQYEQGGKDRSEYGTHLIERLARDLTVNFGRGFGYVNLTQMRRFYLTWPKDQILQTSSEESKGLSKLHTPSEEWHVASAVLVQALPLPWSHYVRLLKVEKPEARQFYHADAGRGDKRPIRLGIFGAQRRILGIRS